MGTWTPQKQSYRAKYLPSILYKTPGFETMQKQPSKQILCV